MLPFRLIVISLVSFLFVTSGVFLRRTTSIFLCGVLSFNSASCYSFLDKYSARATAAPPSSAVVASKENVIAPEDEQKIAGCLFGVCVNLPKIPVFIPSVPSGDQKEPVPPANPQSSDRKELTLSANSQSNVSLAGKWRSDWGPVEFNSDLTGSWNQGVGIGQIRDGTYDSKARKLVFHYYQPWNEMNGTATMTLSEDGSRLSGTWIQQRGSSPLGSGGSGGWTMMRDPSQQSVGTAQKYEPEPEVGDIVIYRDLDRTISHSGVIIATRPDGTVTRIRSKWGAMGVYTHDPNDSIYGESWTVWRAKRKDGSRSNLLKSGYGRCVISGLVCNTFYYTDAALRQDGTIDLTDDKDSVTNYLFNGNHWFSKMGSAIRFKVEPLISFAKFRTDLEKEIEEVKAYFKDGKFKEKITEYAPPSVNYNCHGFTFTDGEAYIPPVMISKILRDNGYFQIEARDTNGKPH